MSEPLTAEDFEIARQILNTSNDGIYTSPATDILPPPEHEGEICQSLILQIDYVAKRVGNKLQWELLCLQGMG